MKRIWKLLQPVVLCLPVACASPPSGQSEEVRLVTTEQLTGCSKVGAAHVSVIDKLDTLRRTPGGVEAELLRLAKGSARQLGGNAVLEMTGSEDGRQSFAIFHCP